MGMGEGDGEKLKIFDSINTCLVEGEVDASISRP